MYYYKRKKLTYLDIYDILIRLPPPMQVEKGGESIMLDMIVSFIFSVLASVVAYYICKWLVRTVQSKQCERQDQIYRRIKTNSRKKDGLKVSS